MTELHDLLLFIVPMLSNFLQLIGVSIIAFGTIKAVWNLFQSRFNVGNVDTKLSLAQSMALALEFKMGAEILKTTTVDSLEELQILGAIVLIRVILSFVIHWEIKTTNEDQKRQIHQIRIMQERTKLDRLGADD